MKKFFNIFLGCASLFIIAYSCEAEQPFYEGESYVHFQEESQEVFAVSGTPYADAKIDYGTTHAVSGSHQVKLVLDPTNSTAVEGVDFQILNNNTSELAAGVANGQFTIRVLTPQMTQSVKFAVFKIQSSTLASAVFSDKITIRMSLTCPISSFIGAGTFKNTVASWMSTGTNYTVVQATSTSGTPQLKIKAFWDNGSDMVLDYNPTTFAVTMPAQATGSMNGTNFDWAQQANGLASSFNPCTRVLTLNVYYHVRNAAGTIVGQYGNYPEVFVGQ